MHDGGVAVRGLYTRHLVPAAGRHQRRRVEISVLEPPEIEGGLDIGGAEGCAVLPLDSRAKLPGHVHLVVVDSDITVLQGGHLGGQLGHPVVRKLGVVLRHVLAGLDGEQPLHHRVDVGTGVRLGGRDVAGEQAVLLLGGNGDRSAGPGPLNAVRRRAARGDQHAARSGQTDEAEPKPAPVGPGHEVIRALLAGDILRTIRARVSISVAYLILSNDSAGQGSTHQSATFQKVVSGAGFGNTLCKCGLARTLRTRW